MKKLLCNSFLIFSFFVITLISCTTDKGIPDYNNYPDDIGKLFFTKCSTPGCHTDASKDAAAGLSMESWDKLFEGGKGSAAVIPFRHDYSTLFSYTNTFSDLGISNIPTMPFNSANLSREEVLLLKNWINAGAPSRDGFVKFSDDPNRKKIYISNQGCDVVTVMDQETLLPMRYIDVGNTGGTESPHMIKVSPDGQYWYVVSISGNSLQKYRTSDDSFVGEAFLSVKNWNTLTISNDGQKAYAIDWSSNGDIAEVDLTTFAVTHNMGYNFPHGSCLNPVGDTLYVTQQNSSNKLYKMPVNDLSAFTEVNLFTVQPASFLNAHEVFFSPDGTKYFVTCQGTSELRIFQQGTDQLLAIIPVGALPSEMSASVLHGYLFVSCPEDITSFPGKRGAVWVIDINTNSLINTIYTGHQPHGIAVDDTKNLVYVANRNATTDGPAPHHSGVCGGRNGYVTFIDMSTLTLLKSGTSDKKVEVSVDPYSVAVRP
ncbi:MAG: hypothetical protein V4511_07700 [Bacteroidota bacterium]